MAGISTSQLEETVNFMVKSSQTQSPSSAVKKPSWWPNNLTFFYPIKRRAEHNVLHWRSHLQDIVHKFNKFDNSQRSSLRLKPRNNNMQLRQSQRTITTAKLKTIIIPPFPPPVTICHLRRNSTSSSIGSSSSSSASNASNSNKWRLAEKPAVLKQLELQPLHSASKNTKSKTLKSPIVHNYINSCNSPIPENIPINVSPCKDNYLNYFGLVEKSDIKNSDIINVNNNLSTKPQKKIYKHNILLCPQIPFSSDIGLKLIKDLSEIPQETFERRLERNERFINQKVNNSCAINFPEEYKSTNKNTDDENCHFYMFPTKKYHSPNKLTPRSRYLLQKYCRPCTVSLEHLEIKSTIKTKIIKNKKSATKNLLYFKQKENTPVEPSKTYLQCFNNSHSNQNLRVSLLKPPMVTTVSTTTNNNNNPSIVLKPINHLFNNKQMHNTSNTKNKVEKHKVNVYYPRRCSTRLKIVKTNNSLTIL